MPTIVLQQVSSKFAQQNAGKTLEKPFALKWVLRHVSDQLKQDELSRALPSGMVHAWGAKAERRHQFMKMTAKETLVLFRRHKYVFAYGVVVGLLESEELGISLWGQDRDGETWPLIFLLRKFKRIAPPALAANINPALVRLEADNWQALNSIVVPIDENLTSFFANELADT